MSDASDYVYCSVLISLAQWSKAHTAALLDLTREIAALRDTVKALDPTFSDVLREKRGDRKKEIDGSFPQNLQPLAVHEREWNLANQGGSRFQCGSIWTGTHLGPLQSARLVRCSAKFHQFLHSEFHKESFRVV